MDGVDGILGTYYEWLLNQINASTDLRSEYNSLLHYLHKTAFVWSVDFDQNRAADGYEMRVMFERETGLDHDILDARLPYMCSVLEMMVALASRMEVEFMHDEREGDRTGEWFWMMIDNLGLSWAKDNAFDESEVAKIVRIFLRREYKNDGKGALFCDPFLVTGFEKLEIWSQMGIFLRSVFG